MSNHHFVEDAFVEFYDLVDYNKITIQYQDFSPCQSFFKVISEQRHLTESQSRYILKILDKYKKHSLTHGLDYQHLLTAPKWKNPFRTIDNTKKIYIDSDEDGNLWLCAKFPFSFKEIFQKEMSKNGIEVEGRWDQDKKVRKFLLRNCNIVYVCDFAEKNGFEIDESVLKVVSDVEEYWQRSQDIVPHSKIVDGTVMLINASEDTVSYWNKNYTGNLEKDLFLAKSLGYIVDFDHKKSKTDLEKICSSDENYFWMKDNDQFFNFYKKIDGVCAVMLDRIPDVKTWIQEFVKSAENSGIDRNLIKVCFRESSDSNKEFNEWVKDSGLGGSVSSGKIYIFQHKPAKWLFKDNIDVKIIATNGLYPSTNSTTQSWMETHPCVVHIGNIKPATQRKLSIVEL